MKQIFLTLICVVFQFGAVHMGVSERSYTVISKDNNIEIRHYEKVIAAEVYTAGDRSNAANEAFRILFKFISGKNQSATKIAMTAPVSQVKTSEKQWKTTFYMPANFTKQSTPVPSDSRIIIKEIQKVKLAAIVFSGFANQKNLSKHENVLINYLKDADINVEPTPVYAFYDAPYVPWFLKRNEVLFKLK